MSLSLTHQPASQPVSLVPIGLFDPPRRRMDRETTPGRCGNLDYCSIGMQRVLVHVPVSKSFVCPECGGALRAPGRRGGTSAAGLLPFLRISILLGGMAAALSLGYGMGRVQPVVAHAVGSASQAAVDKVRAARSALLPHPSAVAPAQAGTETAGDPASPLPALPLVVASVPPPRLPPEDVAAPPARLLREQRFGRVVVDCTLGALVTRPVCHVADRRGGDAFSAAALTWLQDRAVQYAPDPKSRSASLADHRWRVVFEDFSGQARRRLP